MIMRSVAEAAPQSDQISEAKRQSNTRTDNIGRIARRCADHVLGGSTQPVYRGAGAVRFGTSVDEITVLRCDPEKHAAKLWQMGANGEPECRGYDAGRFFSVRIVPVTSIFNLAERLDEVRRDGQSFVIRGEPLPTTNLARTRRLLHLDKKTGDEPTFREVSRSWVQLDFDSLPGPFVFDPTDCELAAYFARSKAPAPFAERRSSGKPRAAPDSSRAFGSGSGSGWIVR
jgi:hypothetical protein